MEQRGAVRCVRCCVRHPKHYELLRAIGGVQARYRWLCDDCRQVYADLGLLGDEARLVAMRSQAAMTNRTFTKVRRAV